MRNWILNLAVPLGAIILLAGCSGSSSSDPASSTTTTTVMGSALSTITEKVDSAAMLKSGVTFLPSANARAQSNHSLALSGLSSIWETADQFNDLYDGSATTLKDLMGDAMNPDFLNSNGALTTVFGRYSMAVLVACAMDRMVTTKDADGLPANGTYSLTVTTDVATACNIASTDSVIGATLPVTITSTTDQTVYTKKIFGNDEFKPAQPAAVLFRQDRNENQYGEYRRSNRRPRSNFSQRGQLRFKHSGSFIRVQLTRLRLKLWL